jgi:hypothetical protein
MVMVEEDGRRGDKMIEEGEGEDKEDGCEDEDGMKGRDACEM